MGITGRLEKGRNLERVVSDMEVGETAYVSPWALDFDKFEIPYLNLNAVIYTTINSKKDRTTLKIIRTGKENYEYDINLDDTDYKWSISDTPFDGTVDSEHIVQLYYTDKVQKQEPDLCECDPNKYPQTYEDRIELNKAIMESRFEDAIPLREKINNTKEPLENINVKCLEKHQKSTYQ